jgi:trigger factor
MEFKESKNKKSADITVKFTLGKKEISDYYKEVYQKKTAELKLPGFRKGKAPVELVEKRLGDAIIPDVIEYAIEQTVKNNWDEFKYPPITEPQCKIEKFEKDKKLIFTIDYATRPEIKLRKYKKFGIILPDVKVTEDDIEREMDFLRHKFQNFEKIDAPVGISQKLILETSNCKKGEEFTDFKEIDFFTRDHENKINENDPELRKQIESELWGKNIGDEIEFEHTYSPKMDNNPETTETFTIRVKIKEIYKKILPDVDDEFAKKMTGFENLSQLKDTMLQRMEMHGKNLLFKDTSKILMEKITEKCTFVIPQLLIDAEIQTRLESLCERLKLGKKSLAEVAKIAGKEEKDFHKEMEEVSNRQLKNQLILNKIAEKEKLIVSDEDLENEYKILSSQSGEKIEDIKNRYKKDDLEWELKAEIKNRKVVEFLIENNTKKKENEILYSDLLKKIETQEKEKNQ